MHYIDLLNIILKYFFNFLFQAILTYLTSVLLAHGEGNGNPLQCSCLENPVDTGAW